MRHRHKMSKSKSKKLFTMTALKSKNGVRKAPMRGGIRL